MFSTAKQNLVHNVRGRKLRFVKSVSRGDKRPTIWTAKVIYHSIKRQSGGKREKFQTHERLSAPREKNKRETRVDVTKKKGG